MTYVLNQSTAGKGAQEFLKKTFNDNVKKFSDTEKALKKEENDLLAKKNLLSKEEYGKKMNSLRKKNIDYQTERRTAIDKITLKRAEARETLLKKLKPILESYIKENSVSLVVDKKYILGGGAQSDITKVIVEKLNKDLPSLNLK
jgi:Skp family chaperone for outer membrane proteins